MMIYQADLKARKKLIPMFKDIESTIILACLQGHMGTAWVDDLDNPKVAQIIVGVFVYYAGDACATESEELAKNVPDEALVIVVGDAWRERVESMHKGSIHQIDRYRLKRNPEHLDREHIKRLLTNLPMNYQLKKIDEKIVNEVSLHELSENFISQFDSAADFIKRGVGFAIISEGSVVSAATSFSIYDEGIEIEIATHPQYRGRGLATITAAALLLDCLDRGLYPSWDAANLESLILAQKLGYVFKEVYSAYFISRKNAGFASQ